MIDLQNTKLTDHSVMENLQHFKHYYEASGGRVQIIGLEYHEVLSNHKNTARKRKIIKQDKHEGALIEE